MSEATTNHVHVGRGAFPALGDKIGLIENTITFTSTSAGDSEQVFVFDADVVVLAAGIDVETALPSSCTLDLGTAEDGTQFVSAQDATATGQMAITTTQPVVIKSTGQISVTVDGATATSGVVRVWALIADIGNLNGD